MRMAGQLLPIDTPEGMAEFIRLAEVMGTGNLPREEFQRVAARQAALMRPSEPGMAGQLPLPPIGSPLANLLGRPTPEEERRLNARAQMEQFRRAAPPMPPRMELPAGVVNGQVVEVRDIVAAHERGDHVVWGGPEVGAFWATSITASPPPQSLQKSLEAAGRSFTG